ncbi:MAG: ABC transporter ATP-binding protein [Clostridia bacterium]|nr:ABC transporter ATP-binding protein [Clostridia bacterium]
MIVEVLGEVLMPLWYSRILNIGVENHDVGFIILTCALMVLTALLMMGGGVGGAWFGSKAAVNFAADLRRDVYAKVQQFSFANIDKYSTGSLVTRLTNDVTQLMNFVNMLLRMFLRAPGMMIGALIAAIALNPSLARVLAVTMPVLALAEVLIIRTGFPRFTAMQERMDHLNSTIQESLTNIRVVKSFVREKREDEKFAKSNQDLKDAAMRALGVVIFMMPMMMLLMNLTSVAVIWFGGNHVIAGDMPIGDFNAFLTYITQILMSLMIMSMLFMNSSRALASARRIKEVMEEKLDLSDDDAAHKDKRVERGDVEFKNVSFRYYKNSENAVLRDINLKINAGETVGVIGSTGCGKTTLVSMIPRLYDADQGSILVDGIDVKDYSLYHLREGVGMVLQKNVLFSGTIADNLRWGDENATEAEMTAAAQSAQADGFIRSFELGYETELEQGGVNVSGGQRQRLCIARALLKHPKILILDDSTSAVDTATEASIRKSFRNELKDSTKIIIAQRITSVIEADKIIVMDDGAITGVGTHDELIKNNRAYQEIYHSQMDGKEAA